MSYKRNKRLQGEIQVPGDKSISHRSIMLGSIASGTTYVKNFLMGADCLATISCFKQMGITIDITSDLVTIHGKGLHGLSKPSHRLDIGNSGTSLRLISGILSALDFEVEITGDDSIKKRPMNRIISPLSQMGANIQSKDNNGCAPLYIKGNPLTGIAYNSPVASAQVKSAILLAGLYADGVTSVTEPYLSRNHTELMLNQFGANIVSNNTTATLQSVGNLFGQQIYVPGDISSAAYFIAAALITPNSEVLIKKVGINPTRDGIIKVCKKMGADIEILNIQDESGETYGDILVKSSNLKGTVIEGEIIPTLIDELPIIAVLACYANGQTIIKDALELKVKESNRIDTMVENLSLMGADITATKDGMIINGQKPLRGAIIDSKSDHRIAMSFAIAGLMANGETTIIDSDCVNISYPDFFKDLSQLQE